MTDVNKQHEGDRFENISLASKEFYSAGSSFSTLGCAAIVLIAWGGLGNLYSPLKSPVCALGLSFLIVFAYALVIPEPCGYPNSGKLRITLGEFLFGLINAFIVFSTAVAMEAL